MEGVVVRVYRFFTVSIYWASCGVLFKGSGLRASSSRALRLGLN